MTSQISTDSNSVDSNSAGLRQAPGCSATLSHRQRNSAGICSTSLVAGIRKGDRSLEKELLHRYYARVKRQVLHYTRDTWRAEDITHDTLLTILLRLRDLASINLNRLTVLSIRRLSSLILAGCGNGLIGVDALMSCRNRWIRLIPNKAFWTERDGTYCSTWLEQ